MTMVDFKIFNCMGRSSHATHLLEPYEKLYSYAYNQWIDFNNPMGNIQIVDLFARQCQWGTIRNDMNPQLYPAYTTHCMDALEFIQGLQRDTAHIVLFDPPFSDRQSNEEYGTPNLYTDPKYIKDLGIEMFRILKPGGYLVKCGYNTNAPARGFDLIKVHIANFGASRNDILFSIWKKTQHTLKVGLN